MNLLISYDIAGNKTRLKVSKILDDYGDRVQKSVFEIPNINPDIWDECRKRLRNKIKLGKNDSIRVYYLCSACIAKIEKWGTGKKPMDDPDVYII